MYLPYLRRAARRTLNGDHSRRREARDGSSPKLGQVALCPRTSLHDDLAGQALRAGASFVEQYSCRHSASWELAYRSLALPLVRTFHRFPFNYNEGVIAYLADRAVRRGLFCPPVRDWVANNYTPLSHYTVGAPGLFTGDNILARRVISWTTFSGRPSTLRSAKVSLCASGRVHLAAEGARWSGVGERLAALGEGRFAVIQRDDWGEERPERFTEAFVAALRARYRVFRRSPNDFFFAPIPAPLPDSS